MAVLNENISLCEFNTTFTYNERQPKDFFRGQAAASREQLPAATVLWKCADFGISPAHRISEWWVVQTHLNEVLRRCGDLGVSLQRYCRARYAVIWEWRSAASYLIEARLLKPVCAFSGQTAPVDTRFSVLGQDTGIKNIALIGGDPQLCIPNLTTLHIAQITQTPSNSLPPRWQTRGLPVTQHAPGTVIRGGRP